nr:choline/ethanolaminephosphotransferase 1-like [Paramormyrops kingsleyae]
MNNSSGNSSHRTPRTRSGRMGETGPEAPRRTLSSQGDSVCSVGGAGAGSCFLSSLLQLPSSPLSRAQLRRLEEHRYSSAGRSLLEPLMQHYWEWLVKRVPPWVAPNLITVVGLVTNIATTLVLVYYCPTATEQAPLWAYLGLSTRAPMWAYLGLSTRAPLWAYLGLSTRAPLWAYLGLSTRAPLWAYLGLSYLLSIDVTEVQIFIIIMYLLAAVGGSAFWQLPIPVISIQMKIVPAIFTVVGAIFSCMNYFRVIFTGGVGKNGSTIAGTSVLSPFFHIGSVITLAVMIYKKSAVQLFERHPCLYILVFGFVSAKITNKLVVAHMTKSEMYLHDLAFLGPGLLFLDQYFNSFIDEYWVLWIALVLSSFDLVRYCISVCNQIASHLHIFVFKIRPPATISSQPGHNHHS